MRLISTFLYGRRAATSKGYVFELFHFFKFLRDDGRLKAISDLDLKDIQAYFRFIAHKSISTQARALGVIKSFFNFNERLGYLKSNPTQHCKKIRADQRLAERILSREEVISMIELEKDTRNKLILKTLYASALRVSELSQLKWIDLKWTPDLVSIEASILGKGGKQRTVWIVGSVVPELLNWKESNQAKSLFVFSSREEAGGPIHPSRILKIVRIAAFRAGIRKLVSPHWLRHSHASHAIDRGAPLHLVRDTLGHSSIITTGLYLHARPDDGSALYLAI
jgi:integrase/recombinase XerD